MRHLLRIAWVLSSLGCLGWMMSVHAAVAQAHAGAEMFSLKQALNRAEGASPGLGASNAREVEAQSAIGIVQSGQLPQLDFEAIESAGFPGSSGLTGIGGLMGSPYRSGLGAGLILTQNVWDFGRTAYGIEAAEHDYKSTREDTRITRYEVDVKVMHAYFDCTLNRAQKETWKELLSSAALVTHEVDRFVHTGQRSIVDTYLAKTQEDAAQTQQASYAKRLEISAQRLSVLMGVKETPLCPSIAQLNDDFGLSTPPGTTNPFIAKAQEQVRSAQARLGQAQADYLPRIVGVGSVGVLESSRSVPKQDYALAAGVIFPLFEGFKTREEVRRSSAAVQERELSAESSQLDLEDLNTKYDETIESSRIQLQYLRDEVQLAQKAFDLAKKRYFSFQGALVDVRDALSNLSRVLTEENTVRGAYFESFVAKQLLNDAR